MSAALWQGPVSALQLLRPMRVAEGQLSTVKEILKPIMLYATPRPSRSGAAAQSSGPGSWRRGLPAPHRLTRPSCTRKYFSGGLKIFDPHLLVHRHQITRVGVTGENVAVVRGDEL